jgi:hypothetical protein
MAILIIYRYKWAPKERVRSQIISHNYTKLGRPKNVLKFLYFGLHKMSTILKAVISWRCQSCSIGAGQFDPMEG